MLLCVMFQNGQTWERVIPFVNKQYPFILVSNFDHLSNNLK